MATRTEQFEISLYAYCRTLVHPTKRVLLGAYYHEHKTATIVCLCDIGLENESGRIWRTCALKVPMEWLFRRGYADEIESTSPGLVVELDTPSEAGRITFEV